MSSAGTAFPNPDGSVLVVARGYLGYQGRLVLVRYLSDGSPDPSFGAAGIDWLTTPGGSWSGAGGAVAPDGRLLASGYLDPSVGLNETAVVRVLTRDAPVASITSAPEGLVNAPPRTSPSPPTIRRRRSVASWTASRE